jgi:arginyl-tRNA synthetase
VLKQLAAKGLRFDLAEGLAHATLLGGAHEQALVQSLSRYPESLALAATQRAPHTLVYYLRDLANAFHTYYNAEQFIVPEAPLRNARLALVTAAQQVIRNGLTLLGVSAPESM